MKKLFFILLFLWCTILSFSQTYLPLGSPFGNNVARLNNLKTFYIPKAVDTTNALNGGLDSLGALVQITSVIPNEIYYRDTTPGGHKWTLFVTGNGGGSLTDFIFTDANGFDGTVTNSTTIPNLQLTTQLTLGSVPFIGTSGALRENNSNFFWDSTNGRLGIGKIPAHKFDVLDSTSSLYFDAGTLNLEDNPDSLNILINSTGTNGSNNLYIGNGIGNAGHGNFNTIIGNKALKFGLDVNNNTAIGATALGDVNSNYSVAVGGRAGQFAQRDSNTSIGFGANRNSYGGSNTAIGANAQTGKVIYTGTIKPSEIQQGSDTYTGTNTATFITNSGLSIGDTAIFFSVFKLAPNAQESPLKSLGRITNFNTITFLNQLNFATGTYDTVTLVFYSKQNNSIAFGNDAEATNSNQFAISPHVDTIYAPGMATSAGYVLTDVSGTGKLTLELSGGNTQKFAVSGQDDIATQTRAFNLNGNTLSLLANSIGTTSTQGLILSNTTNATVGAQQYSPALELDGSGWGTTAPAAQNTKWRMEIEPIQGISPQGKLQFLYSLNNGSYNPIWNITPTTIGNTATLTVNNNITAVSTVTGATGVFTELAGGLTINQTLIPSDRTAKFSDVSPNFVIQTNGTFSTANALFVIEKGGVQHNNQGVSTTSGSAAVLGTGQGLDFNNYFKVGDQITINGETKTIASISRFDSLTTTATFTNTNTEIGFTYPTGNIMTVKNNGGIGIGLITPTAFLDIQAGTQYFAPLRLNAGTDLATGIDGALNWDGTELHIWDGTTKENVLITPIVNSVSPTSPNRTITVVINGTTYYIAAKTTND